MHDGQWSASAPAQPARRVLSLGTRRLTQGVLLLSTLLLGGILGGALGGALSGCGGPTCQSACEKSFQSCGMTWVNEDLSEQELINNCVSACSQEMTSELDEAEAVGWVSCVDAYVCGSSDSGLGMCLTCSSGYYQGRVDGTTCTTSQSQSVLPGAGW